jgi:putative transposase
LPHSLSHMLVHIIFSTKDRQRLIRPEVREELHRYLAGIAKNHDSPAMIIQSVDDHVHVLLLLSKNNTLAKLVEEIKTGSSKWIKTQGQLYQGFHWQSGYGAFSVSQSNAKAVTEYVRNQEKHHSGTSFEDELRQFLAKHGMTVDEKHLWD